MRLVAAFDLDGTLADPSLGVAAGFNRVLRHFGRAPRPVEELISFIGPPTEWIFSTLLETEDPTDIARAQRVFSAYYHETGYAQNRLYPHSVPVLRAVRALGIGTALVTAKAHTAAVKITSLFNLDPLLDGVFGRVDGCSKDASLRRALHALQADAALLVGDRRYDAEAAAACGIPFFAVAWGFGDRAELERCAPRVIATSPDDLLAALDRWAREQRAS